MRRTAKRTTAPVTLVHVVHPMLAIAGQGLSGVQRFLVGSVADKLIRTAAVMVVPGVVS